MTVWIEVVLGKKATYTMLCHTGLQISPKLTVLLSGTLSQTLNVADFSALSPWHAVL